MVLARQKPAGRHEPSRSLYAVLAFAFVFCVAGCPTNKSENNTTSKPTGATTASPSRPAVPLRVWFVGDEAASPIIQRQWLASYDRPLELSMVSTAQLLEHKSCDCDVLVYPSMLLGELTARDWLAELPQRLQPASKNSDGDANTKTEVDARPDPQPPAWQEQARFGRKTWGLSLSVAMPVVLANFSLPERTARRESDAVTLEASKAYWQSIIDDLAEAKRNATPAGESGATAAANSKHDTLDALATCDRFLLIATSLAASDSRIGLLLDPQSMKPRLSEPAFEEAAAILNRLKIAGASLDALAGSHRDAWLALSGSAPNVSISVAPLPDDEVDKVTKIIAIEPPENPARAGSRTTRGWNSGQGLMVSMARDCRQSSVSIDFVRWLTGDATRNVFAKRVGGFSVESAYTPSSSAWQTQRLTQRLAQQSRVIAEPRLPDALPLRMTLGEELIAMLRGEKDPAAAMRDATNKWTEIIQARGQKVMKPAYEQSLGL